MVARPAPEPRIWVLHMSSAAAHEFTIELDEVEEQPKEWAFPIPRAWLATALEGSELSAPEIAREALEIAAGICIYTNEHITVLEAERAP